MTAPSTPAARLRQAATVVREASAKATKGICPGYVQGAVRHIARNCDIHCGHDEHYDGPDEPIWDRYEDAAWIALMNPVVGEALAAMFDQWAFLAEHDADQLDRVGGPETLDVADAVLAAVTR